LILEVGRVMNVALSMYAVNSDPEGLDHGLDTTPVPLLARCYVAAHLVLDLSR
jgi:hypothetical protein